MAGSFCPTRASLFIVGVIMLCINGSQACNLTMVTECVQRVRQDFTYCGDHGRAEKAVLTCQESSKCTSPVVDFQDLLDEFKIVCDLYLPCGQYYSCIGDLVGINYNRVLSNDLLESDKADTLSTRVCHNRTEFDFGGWPACVKANNACIAQIETLMGGEQLDTFLQMDSGFTEVLNRFKTEKEINMFLDHFCSPECGDVISKVAGAGLCTDWEELTTNINQKSAQNLETTQDCKELSRGLDCLRAHAESCDPVLEYMNEFAEDLARTNPGAFLVQATVVCNVDLPRPTYQRLTAAASSVLWSNIALWSTFLVLALA